MTQLIKQLKININIRYMTSTTTTTTDTTTIKNNEPVKTNDIILEETKTPSQHTPTMQEILNKIEENKKIYESVIDNTKGTVNDIEAQINTQESSPSTQKIDIETTISTSADIEHTYKQLENEIQYPPKIIPTEQETTVNIEDAVAPIIASCKLTAEALANKMIENGILIEESEKAEIRQEALYVRIKEFVDSFGITKTALKIGGGIALIYTIYNLIRYRQLPLGGFIKGLFTSTSNAAAETTSNISNPVNNITINMPSLDTIKQNIPNVPSQTSIGTFIDHLGPTGWLLLGGTIWLLRKIK